MKMYSRLLLAVWLALGMSSVMVAATNGPDPFAGTWVMNVEKSTYPPGTRPKQMIIVMEPVENGNGVHYRSKVVYPNGRVADTEYTAGYDGREVAVKGPGVMMPVALRRPAPGIVVATYTRVFQVAAISRRVVSRDGRTMTITTRFTDVEGKKLTTIGIYEKADSAARVTLDTTGH